MGLSLDLLEQANRPDQGPRERAVTSERVTLPAGEALHLRYALDRQGAPPALGRPVPDARGDNQLVVSLTNASEAEATAIAESIEPLD